MNQRKGGQFSMPERGKNSMPLDSWYSYPDKGKRWEDSLW